MNLPQFGAVLRLIPPPGSKQAKSLIQRAAYEQPEQLFPEVALAITGRLDDKLTPQSAKGPLCVLTDQDAQIYERAQALKYLEEGLRNQLAIFRHRPSAIKENQPRKLDASDQAIVKTLEVMMAQAKQDFKVTIARLRRTIRNYHLTAEDVRKLNPDTHRDVDHPVFR